MSQFGYYTNAGNASSRGAELTLVAAPLTGMTVTGTVGYTDAKLEEDASGGIIGRAGEALPYSAKVNASVSLEQHFAVTNAVEGFAGAGVTFIGKRYSTFSSVEAVTRLQMPSFTTLDVHVGAVTGNGWTFTLYARNLTDKLGLMSASRQTQSGNTGINYVNINNPRTIGLSVSKDL